MALHQRDLCAQSCCARSGDEPSGAASDDDEIDRVGDVDLVSRDFVAVSAGEFQTIANTPGRIRQYRIGDAQAAGAYVLSLASGPPTNGG